MASGSVGPSLPTGFVLTEAPSNDAPSLPDGFVLSGSHHPDDTTTLSGLAASVGRGVAPYAAGAATGAGVGALLGGVGAIPGAVAGAGAVALSQIAMPLWNAVAKHLGLPESKTPQEATDKLLDLTGVQRPQTGLERTAEDIASGAAGAYSGATAAADIAPALSRTSKRIAEALAAKPKLQAASGVTSALAGHGAQAIGLGPTAQTIAGMLGGAPFGFERATPEEKAEALVSRRANQDLASGRLAAPDVVAKLGDLRSAGKPAMLPDVLGANVTGEAGKTARYPGIAKEIMSSAYTDRNRGAVSRLTKDINTALDNQDADAAAHALRLQQKKDASPLYDAAYAHSPINPDEMQNTGSIGRLLNRPSMIQGMRNALKIAKEDGVSPTTLGIDLDEEGNPVFVRVPTWQTLDYIKRGLDDVLEQFRDPVTHKLNLSTYGHMAEKTRDQYRGILRELNPDLAKAYNAWSGPAASRDAISFGLGALQHSAHLNQQWMSEATPSEQAFARLGVAQALRNIADKTGPLATQFDRLAGSKYGAEATRKSLVPFFRKSSDLDKLVDGVDAEIKMARKSNAIFGGSATAPRMAEDASGINPGEAMRAAASVATGNPHSALNLMASYLGRKLTRDSPEMRAEVARILSDPTLVPMITGNRLAIPPATIPVPRMLPTGSLAALEALGGSSNGQ